MRICCAQISQMYEDIDTAFARAEEYLASADADMVVFSEQYATGWRPAASAADAEGIKARWISMAKEYHTCIVGSYQKPAGDKPQNVMLVVSPEGEVLAEYAKMHLFTPGGEDDAFSSGSDAVCFEYGGMKFGCAICFDLRFPEVFREYLRLGAHCVIVQAAWPAARVADWELLLRARALENRGYVIGCNCIGYDDVRGVDYPGRSLACDFEGRVIEDAGVFEGGLEWDCVCEDVVCGVEEIRERWGIKTFS
ncbi:MAG: hypothetical protein E7Z71_02865 [Methanocorpusculum parvum]|nr:hypothetical protein [Methanocorpusculum parvum]